MGQKVHPYGFRIGVSKDWKAKWINEKNYKEYLLEDIKLRDFIKKNYRVINVISGGLLIVLGILMATGLLGRFLAVLSI